MRMTLFVDASFCPNSLAAGWGSWAKRDDWDKGRYRGSALRTRNPITSSNAAEIAGIGMSLWQHQQLGDLQGLTGLMIQCDNVAALGFISTAIPRAVRSGSQRLQPLEWGDDPLVAEVMEVIEASLVGVPAIGLRHVKAHTKNRDGRSWVNRRCDAIARKGMISRRKELIELPSG